MRGVVFLGERKLELQDFPDPTPGPGEVVLEIMASGMCGSDLKFYRIKGGAQALGLGGDGSPVIGGHEPCGVWSPRSALGSPPPKPRLATGLWTTTIWVAAPARTAWTAGPSSAWRDSWSLASRHTARTRPS